MRTFISAALHSSQQTHLQYTRAASTAQHYIYTHTHTLDTEAAAAERAMNTAAQHLIFQLALDSYKAALLSHFFLITTVTNLFPRKPSHRSAAIYIAGT